MTQDIEELRDILTTIEDLLDEANEALDESQLDMFERVMQKIIETASNV